MPLADKDQQNWRLKAIGRRKRWTGFFESLVSITNGGKAGAVDALKEQLPKDVSDAIMNADFQSAPVTVMGKKFRPGYIRSGLLRSGMQKVTGGMAGLALEWGLEHEAKTLSEKEVVDELYQLTTVDVKWQLAKRDAYIDEKKVAALESTTGYRFDTQAFYEKMRDAIDQCGDRFYDNTWRTELMPHILKKLFMEETEKMYTVLSEQAQGMGVHSEELLDQTFATATTMMQDIMESYTLDLANKTPLLAAPIRFFKNEKDPLSADEEPIDMTDKEKKRWKNLKSDLASSDATYLTTQSEIRRMRDKALGFIRTSGAKDIEAMFNTRFGENGIRRDEKNKAPDIDSMEAASAILEVRELQRRNKKRGFLNRIFHLGEYRAERQAIERMTAKLKAVFPGDQVDERLNDENYASGKSAKHTAKNVFGLQDVRPRDVDLQRANDFWAAGFDKVKQIGKGIWNGLKFGADRAWQAGAGALRGMINVWNGKKALEKPEEKKPENKENDGKEKDPKAAGDVKEKKSEVPFEPDFDDDMEAIFGFDNKSLKNDGEKKENAAGEKKVEQPEKKAEQPEADGGLLPKWIKNSVSAVGSAASYAGAGIYNVGNKLVGAIQNQFDIDLGPGLPGDDMSFLDGGEHEMPKKNKASAPKEQEKAPAGNQDDDESVYEEPLNGSEGKQGEDDSVYEDAQSKISIDEFESVHSDLEEGGKEAPKQGAEKHIEEKEYSPEELMDKLKDQFGDGDVEIASDKNEAGEPEAEENIINVNQLADKEGAHEHGQVRSRHPQNSGHRVGGHQHDENSKTYGPLNKNYK